MMESTGNLFVDVINILPLKLVCNFVAHGLNAGFVQNVITLKKAVSTWVMEIDDFNKKQLIDFISIYPFYCEMEHIRIFHDDKLLFEAWDGFLYGVLSKDIIVPEWFIEVGYVGRDVDISKDW